VGHLSLSEGEMMNRETMYQLVTAISVAIASFGGGRMTAPTPTADPTAESVSSQLLAEVVALRSAVASIQQQLYALDARVPKPVKTPALPNPFDTGTGDSIGAKKQP